MLMQNLYFPTDILFSRSTLQTVWLIESFLHQWAFPPLCLFPFYLSYLPGIYMTFCVWEMLHIKIKNVLVNYALIHTNKLFLVHLTIYRKQKSQMLLILIGCPPFSHTMAMACVTQHSTQPKLIQLKYCWK